MKKRFNLFLTAALFLVILIFAFRSEIFRIFPSGELVFLSKRELKNEALKAIKNGDEPVSAIVLYNYSIIGRGYNTIISDTNAAGHAIINAINNAIKTIGWEKFNSLDKSSFIIMSTVEPCGLCKAFIKEYGFKKVEFIEKRPVDYWLNNDMVELSYEFGKRKIQSNDLIDSLNLIKSQFTK